MPRPSSATLVERAAQRFGISPPTPTRSTRHGYRPRARAHVEIYLSWKVLGLSVETLQHVHGRSRRMIYYSLRLGQWILQSNALARSPNRSPNRRRIAGKSA